MNEIAQGNPSSAETEVQKFLSGSGLWKGPKTIPDIQKELNGKRVRYQGLTRDGNPMVLEGVVYHVMHQKNDGSGPKYVHYPFSKPRECVLVGFNVDGGGGARIVDADRLTLIR